jgi:Alpha-N-acetylglucosaminidase (NAGLU) N-terminal domain
MYSLVPLLGFFAFAWFVSALDAALDALVQRQLPFHKDKFVFHLETEARVDMKTPTALDTFTLSDGSNATIIIECSTRSACARGLYT